MENNAQIVRSAITTSSLSSGLLNPEQSRRFLKQAFDATTLGGLIRHEMRTAKSGEIDKIGIARRIVRKKTENTDDEYRANVTTSKIEYATTAVRIPWEVSEETLRENIEGQNFEAITTELMTRQLGLDMEDLYINGDEATPATTGTGENEHATPDYDFLKINNGWAKQIRNGGHVTDASGESGTSLDLFYSALAAVPNKYNNGNLRWIMSPRRAQEWELFLLKQIIDNGGAVPESLYKSPAGVPTVTCSSVPDDMILLSDPKNLIVVNTYGVQIRKTTEGKEAIMKDKRFYAIHLDYDPVIEELDATGIIIGLH